MIRGAVEWVAGVFLWPWQALFMRFDDWHALGEWADAVTDDNPPDYLRGPAAMDEF